jgi:hypothetical protein
MRRLVLCKKSGVVRKSVGKGPVPGDDGSNITVVPANAEHARIAGIQNRRGVSKL